MNLETLAAIQGASTRLEANNAERSVTIMTLD